MYTRVVIRAGLNLWIRLLMTQQRKRAKVLPTQSDERTKRLVALTARLVDKMLSTGETTNTQNRSKTDEY
jgi:hypothetical protein